MYICLECFHITCVPICLEVGTSSSQTLHCSLFNEIITVFVDVYINYPIENDSTRKNL